MTSGKSLTSAGAESRLHISNLLLAPSVTRKVSHVDMSCHSYVLISYVAH